MRRRAEPTWVRIAHALLIHGERLRAGALTHEAFWPLCTGANGRPGQKSTCSAEVERMVRLGRYLERRPLRFGPGMGLVVGVSVGTESVRAALVDGNGRLLPAPGTADRDMDDGDDAGWHVHELPPRPRQTREPPGALLRRVAEAARAVALGAFADERLLVDGRLPLLGVAVAWPTPMGRVDWVPTTAALTDPAWRHGDAPGLHDQVAAYLGLPASRVHASNDANAIALAAAFDEVRAVPPTGLTGYSVIALRIGGGLGAGTVVVGQPRGGVPRSAFLESRLISGAGGFAGELGHLPVSRHDIDDLERHPEPGLAPMPDLPCACGRVGDPCLQSLAGGEAFVARMEASGIGVAGVSAGDERPRTSVLLEAMRSARDSRQLRAQRDIGQLIGRCLAAPVLMLNPSIIALSGSLAVPGVRAGIELEQARWRNSHSGDVALRLLEGRRNRYAAARGAALPALRAALYRRLDDLDTPEAPLTGLTMRLTEAEVARWGHAPRHPTPSPPAPFAARP